TIASGAPVSGMPLPNPATLGGKGVAAVAPELKAGVKTVGAGIPGNNGAIQVGAVAELPLVGQIPNVPGVEFAMVNGTKIVPQNYSQLYHGTNNSYLGLPSSMTPAQVAKELFANGLPARGKNIDLIEHALKNVDDRAFRGTTQVPLTQEQNAGAAFWADEGGVVIEIKGASGYDVNAALEGRVWSVNKGYGGNPSFGEQEIAVAGAIAPNMISRVGVVQLDARTGRKKIVWIERKNE
ncbi:hypothetical protein PO883_34410, partial [Massilia sp. DJPM01]|uniref:hypothetical protein n=1 Tax=Massilia sp. DJPM01 TaxID=3024404 RepID=UPI00259E93C2